MNPRDVNRDEEQITFLLAATEKDALPPNHDFLTGLRAQSTEAFRATASPVVPLSGRGQKLPRLWRRFGSVAAALLVAAGLYFGFAPDRSALAFGSVLEQVERADSLHLRVRLERGAKQVEFWGTSKPKRSRWENGQGSYQIADGSKYWVINEKANEARSVSPPPDIDQPVQHLLTLLGLPANLKGLLDAQPVERVRDEGAEVLVYRLDLPAGKGKLRIEARVAVATLRLHSLRTKIEKSGKEEPLGELTVLGFNQPIQTDKFVVSDTLTEDGRIGDVVDVQGIVTIKPVMHERWTPVQGHLVLMPGDWLRTDARGANAAAVRLVKHTGVILGPKTLVELVSPQKIRISEGEIQITAPAKTSIELVGPGERTIAVKGRQFFRVEKEKLVRVDKEPRWLLGFKGATANETLGSLVATVDGRNVPLTVGYHKVSVDIRDQIARTVIEESFVNNTDVQLEGVFYFPLPQDASISGFGMWIGDNLVEADIVEAQRAREIYETILREKRDPGLLEWTGGNIFKARVFPIFAHSEKRIKITYTQVLPLQGSRYRYSYALQSELLQQHPLRELAIDVKVSSAVPLKSVTSPTHPARTEKTERSAHVEFAAQEYSPTRDFEVVVEVDGRQNEVVVVPHRRGDDGYFMLQVLPPVGKGVADRRLVGDAGPLHLLILADTSASIDKAQRSLQATFIGSLLASLGPADTFNLGTCDVGCDWAFAQPVPAEPKNIDSARSYLNQRVSLGWTNLDLAFAEALKQAGPKTHVIYVGDGIITTGDADPVAFGKRLRRLYEGQSATFHAVTLGSSYEPGVLKAIASLGGGSVRKIAGDQGPQAVALDLLGEITRPGVRDLKIEFRGLKVARVYPEELPNLPAGSQQIVLGRYLPEGQDQSGEIIVTGTQAGQPVRFSTPILLKDAEHGNSFVPRLWARMHLDHLLDQGPSVKDEIIALSEEYQIITPYTSLLVLETDADRERFGVKQRFRMRDGEKFFAEGRDQANFDLLQKQMKKAGNWRVALRLSVVRELARLGRNPRMFQAQQPYPGYAGRSGGERLFDGELQLGRLTLGDGEVPVGGGAGGPVPLSEAGAVARDEDFAEKDKDAARESAPADKKRAADFEPLDAVNQATMLPLAAPASSAPLGLFTEDIDAALDAQFERGARNEQDFKRLDYLEDYRRTGWGFRYAQWLNTLFPQLPPASGASAEVKSTWPVEARTLAKSLLRSRRPAKMTGGIEIVRQTDTFDVRWNELTGRSRTLELFSASSWLTRSASDGGQTVVSWCDAKERGTFSKAFGLGRLRKSTPHDLQPPPLELGDYSLASLEQAYAGYTATVEQQQEKERVLLVLKHTTSPFYEARVLIDTARHVILSIEERTGTSRSTTRFDDFVEAAGLWWAQRIETTDGDGKRASLVTQTVRPLSDKERDEAFAKELKGRATVQFLRLPLPTVAAAKKALAAGKTTFDDRFTLMLHFSRTQQWPRVLDHLQAAEKLAADKPGLRWLRSAVLFDSRRHEELRRRYLEDAARLAKAPADEFFLGEHVVGQAAQVLQANEMLSLLDGLRPLYDRQPGHVHGRKRWQQLRVSYLSQTGQSDEALGLQKQLATDYPHDASLQEQYARALAAAGDSPAAYVWLKRVLVKESRWLDSEEESLRTAFANLLEPDDLVTYLADWVKLNPPGRTPYAMYLTALVKTDQIEKTDALMLRWLKEGQVPGELSAPVDARLNAAVYLMLGQGHNLYTNRIEERWLGPLAEAAWFFARHKTAASVAEHIMVQHQFQRSDDYRRLRRRFAGVLAAEIDQLPPEHIRRFINWTTADDAEPAAWTKITDVLRQRWSNETKPEVKHLFGNSLADLLARRDSPADLLAFLRLELTKGPAEHRADYAHQLFNRLLDQPWTAAIETEAFALVAADFQSAIEERGQRLFTAVAALHRLTDKMLEARHLALMKKIDHPEKLTRIELRRAELENRRQARAGLADRLRQEAARQPKQLVPWINIERLFLDVLLDRNLKEAAGECWDFLTTGDRKETPDDPTFALSEVLRQRYIITLMNLAARKSAAPAFVERVLTFLDHGIEGDPDDFRWKSWKYSLLVALDRPRDLEKVLAKWIKEDEGGNRWRIALGYLKAEQGKLAEAIALFEAVEKADELNSAGYRALSGWYLVQNRRADHDRAAVAVYRTSEEYRLSRAIAARLGPWYRTDVPLPSELDKEVLHMFAALFEKSGAPQNYLYQIQQFYQATHDFRLLAVLADGVVGHSAAQVYPFLQALNGTLSEVRDEATADELVKRIGDVRQRARTTVDQRALDLLEVLVERRASEVQNQPGPHIERALTALVRAFKRDWSPGEPRLMADLLAGLHRISQPALAKEQLRQLKALHAEAARGSFDRLHIADRYATILFVYARTGDAIDLLQTALAEFQDVQNGVLPVSANGPLSTFIGFLQSAGHFARAEKYLAAQLTHPVHQQQRLWLTLQLYNLYHSAMAHGSEVSLGSGQALYQALCKKVQGDLPNAEPNHRYQLIELSCGIYRTAHEKKLAGVPADLKTFAFEVLPPILKRQTVNYDSLVSSVANTVHKILGPVDGIAFLLNQIETEPRWLRYNNQDGWSRHAYIISTWRLEAKNLGDLAPRLLKLVTAELRRDLELREGRNRILYHKHNAGVHYWVEKDADFAAVAEEVLAQRKESGPAIQYIADYFFWGLGRHGRAIDILFAGQKLLDETGEGQLIDYLHREGRFADSVPVLLPLVERRPENLHYRVLLMHAYFRTGKRAELLALLKETDGFFHQQDRWTEYAMATLAQSCLQNELYEQAVGYFKEAIPLHERTQPGRGVGNGTLAAYYMDLARAYAGLNKTAEAVDAASAAIVAWGPGHNHRAQALNALKQVLVRSPDLDGYVAHLNQQKQDSAIIRKAVGEAYHDRNQLAKAAEQLRLALELQPNDVEAHKLLIAYYDQAGDKEKVVRQLLQAVGLARRDIKLYQDLGQRYEALDQPHEAERAYTSIVEVLPSEAESHTLLAEIREKQDRWAEAITHWQQVARLRSLEPTGLLKLAAAQIHEKQWDHAKETLRRLETHPWPARFADVAGQVRALRERVAKE